MVSGTDVEEFGDAFILWNDTNVAYLTLPNASKIVVFAMGDVDGDGEIDEFDNTYFTSYYYLNPTVKVNFGKPRASAL